MTAPRCPHCGASPRHPNSHCELCRFTVELRAVRKLAAQARDRLTQRPPDIDRAVVLLTAIIDELGDES